MNGGQRIETNLWVFLAGINGFLAVSASALGAHALEARLTGTGRVLFMQGADYQMSHALALLGVGVLANFANRRSASLLQYAGGAYTAGILLFSGTLYWLGFMGPGSLGALHFLTPVGGVSLLAGWVLLSLAAWRVVWGKDGGTGG